MNTLYSTSPFLLLVAGVAFCSSALQASDPPHWNGPNVSVNCSDCHSGHQAAGGNLTKSAGNVNLCQSCHNPVGAGKGLPLFNADKAQPGVGGTSHAFDIPAINATYSTQLPENATIALRIMDGEVVCSSCHNQHHATEGMGGTSRVSGPLQVTAHGSSGTLSAGGVYNGVGGAWYLVEIEQAGDENGALFRYSNDGGTTWTGSGLSVGSDVPLDSGVTVSFGEGGYEVGECWRLSASWPFLRAALDSGDNASGVRFCRDCHRAWVMDHEEVNVGDGSYKSHPVGVALGANGKGYDRSAPLDGNGAVQASGGADSHCGNDLRLDDGGLVQCLTCHAVHFADGNTRTAGER